MKEVIRKIYVAFDGREFLTPEECKKHDAECGHLMLVALSAEEITDVMSVDWLNKDDPRRPLADALEHIGIALSRARVAAGDKKRERKPKEEPTSAPSPSGRDLVAEAKAESDARLAARVAAGEHDGTLTEPEFA